MATPRVKISVSLPRDLVARIDRTARAEARSRSRVLEGWLRASARDANALVELLSSRLELAIVGQNLTNLRYVTSGTATFFAGPPRRLGATITARF
jgi:outer membrane receptor protein involved in Fe transport